MNYISTLPIKSKLLAVIMLTSTFALAFAVAGFIGREWLAMREEAERDIQTRARILAANLGAAIAFEDSEQATRTLQVLGSRREFECAWVLNENREILAMYRSPAAQASQLQELPAGKSRFWGGHVTVSEPIEYGSERVGAIVLQAKFDFIRGRFKRQVELAMVILMLCWIASFWLAAWLQRFVSGPVHALLDGIQQVSSRRDFTVRVQKPSNDEFGKLVDSFNSMLEMIQARDAELRKVRDELELRVAERTSALETEIDERRRAESALAAEKDRLAVTLRSIGDGVAATDCAGRITLFNAVAEKLTGVSSDNAVGKPIVDVLRLRRADDAPFIDLVGLALTDSESASFGGDFVLVGEDGFERLIECGGSPIRDRQSHVVGVVFVFRDVTEKRRAAEELLKASEQESISLLAGGIAHDFNNILTAIIGNISFVRSCAPELWELAGPLKQAEQAAIRASELTRQLISFTKGGVSSRRPAHLGEIIKDTTAFALHGSKVVSSIEIPDDLWPARVDVVQVSQAIQNIALNAVQAMPNGGTLHVCAANVEAYTAKQLGLRPVKYVKVSIRDTGVGIAAKDLPHVFEPCYTTKKSGSGLGLAVAYSVVHRHEGEIKVESAPGQGTTFHIYLPAAEEQPATQPHKTDEPVSGQGRILVMDDEEAIRTLATAALNRLGYEVETAADGAEAVELYRKALMQNRPFSAVILDLTVRGGMGGGETIRRLRDLDHNVKAIVSSGYSEDAIMANYREHGFVAAVEKPYRLQELSQVLQDVIAGKARPTPQSK
ncbi:MAG: ATP-binding protein [Verrucomicrobiota bacterium]|nr:ATP-binding protein [Verrucomicrobiota bacterium]